MKIYILRTIALFLLFFSIISINKTDASSNRDVTPIDWNSFDKGNPKDENSQRIKEILINTNKYGLTTWWNTSKNFDSQTGTYIDFGGKLEHEIRHPAAMSLGLATSLAFNLYEPTYTNVSEEEANAKTTKLISSLAYQHKVNKSGGWGDHWQSAHWAYFAGFAGWLMWGEFNSTDRENIRQMVEYEANRFINYTVPYWKTFDGKVNYEGDTKAEENAWNAQILQLATAMMPNHPNWDLWMKKNIELMISSAASPSDIANETIVNGKPIKDWINGTNINEDGTVINHDFIHPDYMEFIVFNNTSALQYTLANMPTPIAAFYHSELVYKSFIDLKFESPPYISPGGTIYREDSSDIYYPEGNDWGSGRRMQFAVLDIFADDFGYDKTSSKGGEYWEPLHAQAVLDMQNRHEDGHTYLDNSEDNYRGKEEWVAHHAAWAWIAKWVDHSGKLTTTNASYTPTVNRLAGSGRYETAESISKDGWKSASTVYIARGDSFPDALAGAPLAYQEDAPILLTERNRLSFATKREVERLGTGKVVILGGPSAIEKSVEEELIDLGLKVERISGSNRYDTAKKIADKLNNKTGLAMVVYGENFPDALAAAPVAAKNGYPILLTESDRIPYDTQTALKGISRTYVIGGESVIADKVSHRLPNPTRISGQNRFETAANIMKELNIQPKEIVIANGHAYPDALTGSVLAAKNNANLLLVESNKVPFATESIFKDYSIYHFTVFGGESAVSDSVVQSLLK